MKVWVTKYALSSGVFESEAEICSSVDKGMIRVTREGRYPEYFHGDGKEWHRTRESVMKRVEEMKTKKIASLKKSIKKIESITF
jgi:hypothetical protein